MMQAMNRLRLVITSAVTIRGSKCSSNYLLFHRRKYLSILVNFGECSVGLNLLNFTE